MSGTAGKLISGTKLGMATAILRACAHPLRISLLNYIHQKGSVNVHGIYKVLKLEQAVASQQLKILRDAGLVLTNRKGKFIFYSLNYTLLNKIALSIDKLLNA